MKLLALLLCASTLSAATPAWVAEATAFAALADHVDAIVHPIIVQLECPVQSSYTKFGTIQ